MFTRWILRHTQIDTDYLKTSASWMFFSSITTSILYFLSTLLFTRLFNSDDLGVYRYLLTLTSLLSVFSLSGMNNAVMQAVAKNMDGTYTASIVVQKKYVWGIVVTGLMVSLYYYLQAEHGISITALILSILLPWISVHNTYSAFLLGKKSFSVYFRYNLFYIVLPTLMSLVIAFYSKSPYAAIITGLLLQIVILCIFNQKIKKQLTNAEIDKHAIEYGKHTSVSNIISNISSNIEHVLLFNLLGPTQLAIYVVTSVFPNFIKTTLKNFYTVMVPRFSQRNIDEIKSNVYRKFILGIIGLCFVVLVYIYCNKFLLGMFFPSYEDYYRYSVVLSISILGVISILPQAIFNAGLDKKSSNSMNMNLSLSRLIIICTGFFLYGFKGVIISIAIHTIYSIALSVFYTYKIKHTKLC